MGAVISRLFAMLAAPWMFCAAAAAQDAWPTRPLRIVVGFPAGGATDVLARVLAPPLAARLGQPVIVENKPGAGGSIGTRFVAQAQADGHTLLMGTIATHGIQPSLLASLPYDPVLDFAPIVQVASQPYAVVVHPAFGAQSLAEFAALAKARPGEINYASASTGTASHLFAELYRAAAGLDIVPVHYSGAAPAMNDVLGGRVPLTFDVILTTLPQIRAGRLRALAVTSAQRSPLLPGVPTVAEQGFPGYDAVGWNGLFAPAATPRPIVERLNREANAALEAPEVRERVESLGAFVVGGSSAEFADFIRRDAAKWRRLIREQRISAPG